eukprot:1142097-Pelagomonas_calceolata.AAC.2
MPAKMASPGSRLLARLISRDGCALHQEHILGGLGVWSGGPENRFLNLNFGREMASYITEQPLHQRSKTYAGTNDMYKEGRLN